MKKRAMDFIVCPQCQEDFDLTVYSEENNDIKEGLLVCSECKQVFPIVNSIPRIIKGIVMEYPDFNRRHSLSLDSQNRLLSSVGKAVEIDGRTQKSFSYQWTRKIFSEVIPKFEADFLNYISPVEKGFFKGKIGVDIGCGFGRHIYYACQFGAEMVGIDFSRAIESTYNNTRELENIHLIQADIYYLPLRKRYFDFVYSIGVLHHLPDPEKGFRSILKLVKPKGHIFVWLYSKSRPFVNFIIELARFFTKRIPHFALYFICIILSALEWAFILAPYRLLVGVPYTGPLVKRIVFKRIEIYSEYPFNVLAADWFDRLAAPIRFYYNEGEIRKWFRYSGVKLIKISPTQGYGWRAFGENNSIKDS